MPPLPAFLPFALALLWGFIFGKDFGFGWDILKPCLALFPILSLQVASSWQLGIELDIFLVFYFSLHLE